jgi:hypothetical protein
MGGGGRRRRWVEGKFSEKCVSKVLRKGMAKWAFRTTNCPFCLELGKYVMRSKAKETVCHISGFGFTSRIRNC